MSEVDAAPRRQRRRVDRRVLRRRRRLLFGALAVALLALIAVAALAYKHFHHPAPPPEPELRTITLTIPEGYNREQTAELAREAGLRGSYLKASKGHEGFLFPDTFELERGAPASDLVALQLEDFKRRIAAVNMAYARSKNLTPYDVVTIASMSRPTCSGAYVRSQSITTR